MFNLSSSFPANSTTLISAEQSPGELFPDYYLTSFNLPFGVIQLLTLSKLKAVPTSLTRAT